MFQGIKHLYENTLLTINHAISLLMPEFMYKSNEGITDITIKSGITADKTITHDDARIKFHRLLTGLLEKGWSRRLSLF